jgi:hypothetical protein
MATSLLKQIEKIQNDRIFLRSVIQSMLAIARDAPGAIKPAVAIELQKALDKTADPGEGA